MASSYIDRDQLLQSLAMACDWIIDISQHRGGGLPPCDRAPRMLHRTWDGALKGEYRASTRKWDMFCPVWHTGQAVKALCAAYTLTGVKKYLEGARRGADFLLRERFDRPDQPDYGLIWAIEDYDDTLNVSAILECLDGLLALYTVTGEERLKEAFLLQCDWVARRAYLGDGLFLDNYSLKEEEFVTPSWIERFQPVPGREKPLGRPLLDDAIFLKAYNMSSDVRYKKIFYETADRLRRDEYPEGTWGNYPPCGGAKRTVHPRQSYWWGNPMFDAFTDSKKVEYLRCFERACCWYQNARCNDGGLLRGTTFDFKTDSFGHATSGVMCACIMWDRMYGQTGDPRWLEEATGSLRYAMDLQFIDVSDPNLRGAILEKVLPPKNSDASPFYLRDLGTIFFVQAACAYLARL